MTNVALPYRDSSGEILRHELNSPLTGILGNAEFLLAEARRLSQTCEAHSEQVRSA
jgi:signal transduction histidine kinase